MAASDIQGSAVRLSEALGVDLETSCAALRSHGGDADAAAAALLAAGQGAGAGGDGGLATGALGTLLEMGYAQTEAEQALAANQGDLELALTHLLGGGDVQPVPADSTQPAHADAAEDVDVDVGDCAICCEPLRASDAAMRCAGGAGSHHYGHAACLAQWVQQCRRDGVAPSCPTCRGPLQLHRRNLREFLQQGHRGAGSSDGPSRGRCRASQEDSELLHSMLDQNGRTEDGDEDPWSDINFEQVAGCILAAGAVVAIGFAASALFDHFAQKEKRSRR
uniref:UBA domain-containing protein n=1 Tax=Alexandrium catenella TaxID=2925 RepID=A0A7S1WRR9_ALECA|mmetsp:Transcript_85465/g.227014  ORF Transcript_85465/g.227014 Transcript_85465/m.227014 type:complete len:278 (+) Transcript_85465:76-909(+)